MPNSLRMVHHAWKTLINEGYTIAAICHVKYVCCV